jgi:hypothetical protein
MNVQRIDSEKWVSPDVILRSCITVRSFFTVELGQMKVHSSIRSVVPYMNVNKLKKFNTEVKNET